MLGLLNWAWFFHDAMHSRGLIVVLLAAGAVLGAVSGLFVAFLWAVPAGRWSRWRPDIVPYAIAWGTVGPFAVYAILEAALRIRALPAGRLLAVIASLVILAAAGMTCAWLGRLIERAAGRRPSLLRGCWLAFRLAAVGGLAVLLVWLAAPRLLGSPARRGPHPPAAAGAAPPNIILVSFDTLRPDHVSAMGYPRATTPHIDEVIGRSVLFTQTISSSSWTIPSHATLMTGASPSRIGPSVLVPAASGPVLPQNARTLAEILADQGYHTAAFIGGATMRSTFGFAQGFDVYDDIMPPSLQFAADTIFFAPQTRRLLHLQRGEFLRSVDPYFIELCNLLYAQGHLPPKESFLKYSPYPRRFWNSAEAVNAKVDAYLKHRPPGPQFLFVHYFDPHSPYDARPPFFGRWGNDGTGLGYIEDNGLIEEVMGGSRRQLTPHEKEVLIGSYDEKVAYMDEAFGGMMKRLDEEGLLDGAIVALFSDHGESFGEHNDLFHGHSLDEELIRILFSIRLPGPPSAGARIDAQVRAADIMPTILDLAGVVSAHPGDAPPIDGVSLVPLIRGGGTGSLPNEAFSELFATKFRNLEFGPFTEDQFSLRADGWKLVRHSDGGSRLFNLADDPGERVDLSTTRPDIVLRMGGRLNDWLKQGFKPVEEEHLDERRIEELKGLGYIDSD